MEASQYLKALVPNLACEKNTSLMRRRITITNTDHPWRFYGREKEKKLLKTALGFYREPHKRIFAAVRIAGRRWVGKTQLVEEVQNEVSSDIPFIYFEVPDQKEEDYKDFTLAMVTDALLLSAKKIGLSNIDCLQVTDPLYNDFDKCQDVLLALIQRGVILVFDEFHNGKGLGLTVPVKKAIDVIRKKFSQGYTGSMVLMGSHQQKFDALFEVGASFHGRVRSGIHLEQWSLKTTMEMAAEQGLLEEPSRFLTLWTAYGGMPLYWLRYCTENTYAHLHTIKDMDDWRKEFLAIEENNMLAVKGERFDDRTYIELQPLHTEILLWFAKSHHNTGFSVNDIVHEGVFGEEIEIEKKMFFFQDKLKLMKNVNPFDKFKEKHYQKWFISDNNTLFQLNVYREMFNLKSYTRGKILNDKNPDNQKIPTDTPLDRLKTLEGHSLERMVAEFYETLPNMKWAIPSARHSKFKGDIDIMGVRWEDNENVLYLADAKRDPRSFKEFELVKDYQNAFMKTLMQEKEFKKYQDYKWKRVLVAPYFNDDIKTEIKEVEGFELLDIPLMCQNLLYDPDYDPKLDQVPGTEYRTEEIAPDFVQSEEKQDIRQSPWYEDPST